MCGKWDGLVFVTRVNVREGGRAVGGEPRNVGRKVSRDATVSVSHEKIQKLCKLRFTGRHD